MPIFIARNRPRLWATVLHRTERAEMNGYKNRISLCVWICKCFCAGWKALFSSGEKELYMEEIWRRVRRLSYLSCDGKTEWAINGYGAKWDFCIFICRKKCCRTDKIAVFVIYTVEIIGFIRIKNGFCSQHRTAAFIDTDRMTTSEHWTVFCNDFVRLR